MALLAHLRGGRDNDIDRKSSTDTRCTRRGARRMLAEIRGRCRPQRAEEKRTDENLGEWFRRGPAGALPPRHRRAVAPSRRLTASAADPRTASGLATLRAACSPTQALTSSHPDANGVLRAGTQPADEARSNVTLLFPRAPWRVRRPSEHRWAAEESSEPVRSFGDANPVGDALRHAFLAATGWCSSSPRTSPLRTSSSSYGLPGPA